MVCMERWPKPFSVSSGGRASCKHCRPSACWSQRAVLYGQASGTETLSLTLCRQVALKAAAKFPQVLTLLSRSLRACGILKRSPGAFGSRLRNFRTSRNVGRLGGTRCRLSRAWRSGHRLRCGTGWRRRICTFAAAAGGHRCAATIRHGCLEASYVHVRFSGPLAKLPCFVCHILADLEPKPTPHAHPLQTLGKEMAMIQLSFLQGILLRLK